MSIAEARTAARPNLRAGDALLGALLSLGTIPGDLRARVRPELFEPSRRAVVRAMLAVSGRLGTCHPAAVAEELSRTSERLSTTLALSTLLEAGLDVQDPEPLLRVLEERSSPRDATVTDWPTLAPEALHGLAGRIVRTIAPHSEADPAAILAHVLVGVGTLVGPGPHVLVEKTAHRCREFFVLVGLTSKSRKGQSWSVARYLFEQVDEPWARHRFRTGLSSGEGLIYHVRDARQEEQPIKEGGRVVERERVVVDSGEADKRLLVIEPELASVLRRMRGESNSLSAVLRQAWDDGDLSTLTRNAPLRATGAHVSVVGHVTQEELLSSLAETERVNGFANRFVFLLTRRARVLPEPQPVPEDRLRSLADELRRVVDFARAPREIGRDAVAREVWATVYPKLSDGEAGLLGAVLARAEAHVLRLSLIYAILGRSPLVCPEHLKAALAVWGYADASARRIFGDRLGLSVADAILMAVKTRGPLTRTDIAALFHRNQKAAEIELALRILEDQGKLSRSVRPPEDGRGRPAEVWGAGP